MNDESDECQEDKLRELMNDALNLHPEELKIFKSEKELRDKLKSIIAEYLDSFYIFGYDIDGKAVLIKGAHSEQQHDALDSLAIRLFVAGSLGPSVH